MVIASCSNNDMDSELLSSDDGVDMEEPDPTPPNPEEEDQRTPCENGFAGDYPCNGYDLMALVSLEEMDADSASDSWGWTDAATGIEYAIIGLNNGTGFINISSPSKPVYLGKLPTRTVSSSWRDIKVYNNHAFVVSEATDHGMQIFNLTRLRNIETPTTFEADAEYLEFGSAHNVVINEESGFAYVVGSDTFSGGAHFINIQDPENPVFAGGYAGDSYTHDAQVVTYHGLDADYVGHEIYVGSNEDSVTVIDVTDKTNPIIIAKATYPNVGYVHQGWFTEDHNYFLVNDELDEINFGFNTRTFVFDFSDMDNPVQIGTYTGPTQAIDHNHYIKGSILYQSNYSAGIRFVDISDVANGNLSEIGFFDTYPENDETSFNGVWSNYPFFDSGNVVVSDINRGLFIVRRSGT